MSHESLFTEWTARAKHHINAEGYTANPESVARAYTEDCVWRNRSSFLPSTASIVGFLTKKWQNEKSYRLRKELFAFTDNKIAVHFWYEYQDTHDGMKWRRCYGLEDLTVAEQMSGNDVVIREEERWFKDGLNVNEVEISENHW